ncbi:IclR family transcriptional regulator [soil metagenome]
MDSSPKYRNTPVKAPARHTARRSAKPAVNGSGSDDPGGSRSVRRALDIFELMLERGKPVAVAEIVETLQIPKSTAYELVRTLGDAGYIEQSAKSAAFFLGRKLHELGMAYRSQVDLMREGGRIVEDLRDKTGETIQLSVFEGDMMLVILKEEGRRSLRIISQVGSRVPVNWAAAARLLVSDLGDETLSDLLKRTVRQSPSGKAILDVKKLIQQIRRFRKQGYATELNESNEHAGCVAAPIIDDSGRCVAAISIVAPEQRLGKENREQLIAAVRDAAEKLSRRLGGAQALP